MGLIFKENIALNFNGAKFLSHKLKARKSQMDRYPWGEKEIEYLITLRALKVSFSQCDKMLKRKQGSCSNCIQFRNLYEKINSKRQALIQGVLKDD